MQNQPKVSVNMVAFNHAEFIAKALDSVLMQRVSFDYEVLIGDDCSTDGTVKILKDYQGQWPDRIKPTFRERNIGAGKNWTDILQKCTGEYIVFLEGDDYWTDPDKLQMQVDYLDKHRDCALVHHRVEYIAWPSAVMVEEFPPPRYRVERPGPRELSMVNYIQTSSIMFRRKWLPELDEPFQSLKLGDWPFCVLLSQHGWIGYIDRTMAHYRVHGANSWNNRPSEYKMKAMEEMAWFLLERVDDRSKDWWKDTILALAFKDVCLSIQSFAPGKSVGKLKTFIERSIEFRKPFWVFNRLWRFCWANYRGSRKAGLPAAPR